MITLPPGLVAVEMGKSVVLILTEQEYVTAVKRGKSWRRRLALVARCNPAIPGAGKGTDAATR